MNHTRILQMAVFSGILSVVAFAAPPSSDASEDGGTRTVFGEMPSVRGRAMGGAHVALATDASSVDWNPGGLGFVQRRGALVLRADYYGLDIAEQYAAFVWPDWRWGVGAISVQHFGVSGVEGRDARNGVTDPDLGSSQTQVSLGYGKQVQPSWGVGGSLRLQRYQIAGSEASAIAVDLGTQLKPGALFGWNADFWERTTVGVSARNLVEPEIRLDRDATNDPAAWRFGGAYEHPLGFSGHVIAAVDFERSRGRDTRMHAGLEVQLHPSIALRSGLSSSQTSVGAGFLWRDIGFDYVLENNDIGDIHRVGLSYEFGRTTEESQVAFLAAEEARLQSRLEDAFESRQERRVADLAKDALSSLQAGDLRSTFQSLSVIETLAPDDRRAQSIGMKAWIMQAQRYEQEEQFSQAAIAYGKVLAVDPQSEVAQNGYARAQEQSDRRARRSEQVRGLFAKALDSFSSGDFVQARTLLDQVLELKPKDEDARAMRDRTRDAINRQVEELAAQADQFLRAGLIDESTDLVRRIGELTPGSVKIAPLVNRISAKRAELAARRNASSGRNAPAGNGTAPSTTSTRSPRGSDPAGGRERTDGVADSAMETGSQGQSGSEGQSADQRQRPVLSEAERQELEGLYRRGTKASQEQRSGEAVRYLELVYASDPGFPGVADALKREYLVIGMDHFASSRLDSAIEVWQRALEIDPKDEKVRGYLKRALQNRSRTEELLGNGR